MTESWLTRTNQAKLFHAGSVALRLLPFPFFVSYSGLVPGRWAPLLSLGSCGVACAVLLISALAISCPRCRWRPVAIGFTARRRLESLQECPNCVGGVAAVSSHRRRKVAVLLTFGCAVVALIAAPGMMRSGSDRAFRKWFAGAATSCSSLLAQLTPRVTVEERERMSAACDPAIEDGVVLLRLRPYWNEFLQPVVSVTIKRRGKVDAIDWELLDVSSY